MTNVIAFKKKETEPELAPIGPYWTKEYLDAAELAGRAHRDFKAMETALGRIAAMIREGTHYEELLDIEARKALAKYLSDDAEKMRAIRDEVLDLRYPSTAD